MGRIGMGGVEEALVKYMVYQCNQSIRNLGGFLQEKEDLSKNQKRRQSYFKQEIRWCGEEGSAQQGQVILEGWVMVPWEAGMGGLQA